jgi:type III secretion protein J
MTLLQRLLLLAICFVLSACNEMDLYTKLTERQANEMVAALQGAGIEAAKSSKDPGNWVIQVARDDFGRAVETLRAEGLPRDEFESLGRVFKKEGFVSSPLEERARLIYGLTQELSSTISAIDGVVVARVHLAVPERDPLSDKSRSASASVMVKHRSGTDLSGQVGQIKALVVNSVEGLTYDNVTVSLFPTREPLQSARNPAGGSSRAAAGGGADRMIYAAAGAVVLVLLAGVWYLRERRWRLRLAAK